MSTQHNTPSAPSGQQPNSNTPPKRRRYTRRQFFSKAGAFAVIAATRANEPLPEIIEPVEASEEPNVSPLVKRQIQRLSSVKRPIDNLLMRLIYLTLASPGEVDADELVELWSEAEEASKKINGVLISSGLEKALIELAGKDNHRQACARRFPGYEL